MLEIWFKFQILRLDDDTKREETFRKIGDSEVLNIVSYLINQSVRSQTFGE